MTQCALIISCWLLRFGFLLFFFFFLFLTPSPFWQKRQKNKSHLSPGKAKVGDGAGAGLCGTEDRRCKGRRFVSLIHGARWLVHSVGAFGPSLQLRGVGRVYPGLGSWGTSQIASGYWKFNLMFCPVFSIYPLGKRMEFLHGLPQGIFRAFHS